MFLKKKHSKLQLIFIQFDMSNTTNLCKYFKNFKLVECLMD